MRVMSVKSACLRPALADRQAKTLLPGGHHGREQVLWEQRCARPGRLNPPLHPRCAVCWEEARGRPSGRARAGNARLAAAGRAKVAHKCQQRAITAVGDGQRCPTPAACVDAPIGVVGGCSAAAHTVSQLQARASAMAPPGAIPATPHHGAHQRVHPSSSRRCSGRFGSRGPRRCCSTDCCARLRPERNRGTRAELACHSARLAQLPSTRRKSPPAPRGRALPPRCMSRLMSTPRLLVYAHSWLHTSIVRSWMKRPLNVMLHGEQGALTASSRMHGAGGTRSQAGAQHRQAGEPLA